MAGYNWELDEFGAIGVAQRAFAGDYAGAASGAATAVGTAIAGPVGGAVAGKLISFLDFGSKSVANWRRTWGRFFRAFRLGYLDDDPFDPRIIDAARTLTAAWRAQGDSTGARLWARAVQVLAIPTEKGGTKEGFSVGAPAGSKTAEAAPDFKGQLSAWLAAIGV